MKPKTTFHPGSRQAQKLELSSDRYQVAQNIVRKTTESCRFKFVRRNLVHSVSRRWQQEVELSSVSNSTLEPFDPMNYSNHGMCPGPHIKEKTIGMSTTRRQGRRSVIFFKDWLNLDFQFCPRPIVPCTLGFFLLQTQLILPVHLLFEVLWRRIVALFPGHLPYL
jgi:hypothetical protein